MISTMFTIVLFSCASTSKEDVSTLTSSQLIQRGQDASYKKKYKDALYYYNLVIENFGTNQRVYVEARYEMGHTYMKQKNYKQAYPIFKEIITMFENSSTGALPASYKKLAIIELEKIPKQYIEQFEAEEEKARVQAQLDATLTK